MTATSTFGRWLRFRAPGTSRLPANDLRVAGGARGAAAGGVEPHPWPTTSGVTASRRPHGWNHELFGPPHREAELPVLEAAHAGLRRLRLLRRQRETLRTTTRGRRLLTDPDALLAALHGDMGAADRFDADAWPLVEAALRDHGLLDVHRLIVRPLVHLQGWREEDGAAFGEHSLWHVLHPLVCRAEGYGLAQRSPNSLCTSGNGSATCSISATTGACA